MSETLARESIKGALRTAPFEYVPRADRIEAMQAIAPPGLENHELSDQQIADLKKDTSGLVAQCGEQALAERVRYREIENRTIHPDRARLVETYQDKIVLVTGGTGLIGAGVVNEVSALGAARVVSVSRGITVPKIETPGAEYLHADVMDEEAIKRIIKEVSPDIIIHTAAQKYPGRAEDDISNTLRTNIFGTKYILEAAEEAGVEQFVYASTGKATRPFAEGAYAASKKVAELLMVLAAKNTGMLVSGARFTHVVNYSNVTEVFSNAAAAGEPLRLHHTDDPFYGESIDESVKLLLNAGAIAVPGEFKLTAIRDLELPINLTDLAIGIIMEMESDSPIYFCGVEPGYEDKAWPGLYDWRYQGDTSPLINFCEAPDAEPTPSCPEIDGFTLDIDVDDELMTKLAELERACGSNLPTQQLQELNWDFGWEAMKARFHSVPISVLEGSARRMVQEIKIAEDEGTMTEEHARTYQELVDVLQKRRELVGVN